MYDKESLHLQLELELVMVIHQGRSVVRLHHVDEIFK